jgi:hypothetical protein
MQYFASPYRTNMSETQYIGRNISETQCIRRNISETQYIASLQMGFIELLTVDVKINTTCYL